MTEVKSKYDTVISWGLIEELIFGVLHRAKNIILKGKDDFPEDLFM
jgi:hypothetical protein